MLKEEHLFRRLTLRLFFLFILNCQLSTINYQLSIINCQLSIGSVSAQTNGFPCFERNQQIPVVVSNDSLSLAWAGGLNSVAFFAFDLTLDGHNDLIAFEKNGNRLLPFVKQGPNWHYAPEYKSHFPELHDWVIFKDYDQDGKKDIFTYGLAGIRVFKNTSQEQLEFTLVSPQLTSFYYNGYSNIYASPDDNLVVADVDHDGDLDILNFWLLGKYVHYQRNYALENNLTNGWLDFRLEDECWGKFSEGADNNEITLLSYCQDKEGEPTRHVGSTMSLMDFNHDGLDDLILGDIDYAQVVLLLNGGTPQEALMVAQTNDFPNAIHPVNMYSMPLVSPVDLNGDGQDELLVSPADPSLTKSQNSNSVWLYEYDSLLQQFTLNSTNFLQTDMIDLGSGCYPVLYDWNGDGLLDLFAGNYGYNDSSALINGFLTSYYSSAIAYFENIGTHTETAFRLVNDDFGNLRALNKQALYPAFGDLDGDGQTEMICGCSDGSLLLVKANNLTENFLHINTGAYSTPQLFDLDCDGKADMLIGNRRGQIAYYRNTTSGGNISFQLETTTLGDVDVRDEELSYFGFSTPCFFRQDGETKLICGNEQGKLYYYNHIDNNLEGSFSLQSQVLPELVESRLQPVCEGIRVGVAIGTLNGDSYPDMIVGNYAGGMSFFDGRAQIPFNITSQETEKIGCYPNPAREIVNIVTNSEKGSLLQLYDLTGRKLREIILQDNHYQLDISNLKASLYLLKLTNGEQSLYFKIVKQK